MAIVREFYKTREDGVSLYRTFSNENKIIVQNETGAEYVEAIDNEVSTFTYTETDKLIETHGGGELADEATDADYQAALEDLGVNFNE